MSPLSDAALVMLISAGGCLVVGRMAVRRLTALHCMAPTRYEDCPPLQARQHAKGATPTMGGFFVLLVGVVVAVAAGGMQIPEGGMVLSVLLGLGAVGYWDDLMKFRRPNAAGLRRWPRLLAALGIGGGIGAAMMTGPMPWRALELPWMHRTVDLGWGWIPFAMVVVAGCAHAVNLTDGMDGLAPGCLAIAFTAIGLMVLEGNPHHQGLLPWCASLAGACIGFLWFNSVPASVFLGDVGALGLGGALAALSLLTQTALWLVVIGGVFVAEALSVILQVASYKWCGGRRIFRVAPLHHHVHLGGISEPKLMVRFWIVGLLLALVGLTAGRG